MKSIANSFVKSAASLKSVKTVVTAGLLTAMVIVLGAFDLELSQFVQISLEFLPLAVAGMLFGPCVGMLVGGLSDVISSILFPHGPFFPGFTLNAILRGLIYGLLLYRNRATLSRVFFAQLLDGLIVNMLLTTAWLCAMYGQALNQILIPRMIKNLIMLPISTAMLFVLAKLIVQSTDAAFHRRSRQTQAAPPAQEQACQIRCPSCGYSETVAPASLADGRKLPHGVIKISANGKWMKCTLCGHKWKAKGNFQTMKRSSGCPPLG